MNASIPSRFLIAVICAVVLGSVAANAQLAVNFSRPVVGYVFDVNTRALRPIEGIVGSATIGRPVDAGFEVSQVLTLDANTVIASTSASRELAILRLGTNPLVAASIPDTSTNPALAVASIRKTAAAFYYADARQVIVVTGLPRKPVVSRRIDLSTLGGPLTRIAIANDGNLLAFAVHYGEREAIYAWTASSDNARFLMSALSVSDMAITDNGAAIVADRGANEVFAIWDAGASAVRQLLAGAGDGISIPVGVAVGNNQRIYIGNSGSSTVTIMDSAGHYLASQNCSCNLTGFHFVRDSLFRLTERIDRAIFLLDAISPDEQIVFVPPAKD